jgi:glyoxylate reductase
MTLLGRDVHSATLGIIGFGAIGQAMARRASGFGMRVLYLNHGPRKRKTGRRDGGAAVSLPRLLAEADFVSIHVPLTPKTRRMIGAREFSLMRPGAILINTARGAVVHQAAMLAALKSGRLAGAGLDVTDPEPIARHHPLLQLDNVVITPHIGSASIATRARMAAIAVENILDVFAGRLPRFCANPRVSLRRYTDATLPRLGRTHQLVADIHNDRDRCENQRILGHRLAARKLTRPDVCLFYQVHCQSPVRSAVPR